MPYSHGWHIDALSDHLQAITAGELLRVLITIPPGTMKSLMTSVFWPAWELGPAKRPSTRYVATSYGLDLAIRDNMRTRRLIQSEWYQTLWGDGVTLVKDQNEKTKFELTSTGFRQAAAFKSTTGARGDRVIIDDPISVADSESPAERATVNRTFREAIPTRLVSPQKSAIIVIMQRLHARDVAGLILDHDWGYEHLCLPMEFESNRRCHTSIGFVDPRVEDGELLFKDRFPRHIVERDKSILGAYASAGQFQQRPAPRDGGMFKREWFKDDTPVPAGARRVRCWDLAASVPAPGTDPAWTCGVLLATHEDRYWVEHVDRFRKTAAGVEARIKAVAQMDGAEVPIRLPQDPGQAGKSQVSYLIGKLAGYAARSSLESGSKITRATPFAAQCEAGNVTVCPGEWNEVFFDELGDFPNGAFKDQVDAASNAFAELQGPKAEFW